MRCEVDAVEVLEALAGGTGAVAGGTCFASIASPFILLLLTRLFLLGHIFFEFGPSWLFIRPLLGPLLAYYGSDSTLSTC